MSLSFLSKDSVKMITRSTSSAATAKLTKMQLLSFTPLSSNEFRYIISGIQKAQEDLLAGFKS
jgi:hypothetical protein